MLTRLLGVRRNRGVVQLLADKARMAQKFLLQGRKRTGTIRGDLAMSVQANLVHASDSLETAEVEVARFFSSDELFQYEDVLNPFIYSSREK